MQLFQQDHINKFLAKFKNDKLETQFLNSLERKRQIPLYLVLLAEVIWAAMRLIMGVDQQNELQTLLVCSGFMLIFRFTPSRFQKYLLLIGQVYSTYNVQTYLLEYNSNSSKDISTFQINFQNGMMQVIYYVLESQNFALEIISMLTNFSILVYYMQMPTAYLEVYIMSFLILIICKHYQNVNQRRLFLSLKNFEELEKINNLALSNILFIQQFDKRTYEMKLIDCNEKAKKFNIHKSQEIYNDFLQSISVSDLKLSSSMLIGKSNIKKLETLKDILLIQHAHVYEDMVKKKEEEKKKQKKEKKLNQQEDESLHLLNGDLKVSWTDQESKKKYKFNVKIVPIYINEPLLFVFLEDITIYSKFTNLKVNKDNEFLLQQSTISFLSDKLQEIMVAAQISVKQMQRQLISINQALNFLKRQELSQIYTEEFSLSTIINQVMKLYEDFPQIKYINQLVNDQIKSYRQILFSVILAIFSSIKNPKEIMQVITKPSQNKFSTAIKLEIIIGNIGKNVIQYKQQLNFYNSLNYSLFFEAYNNYIKNLMQKICLNNYYSIETDLENDTITLSIEILQDLQVLNNQNLVENKDLKLTQSPYINYTESNNNMITNQSFMLASQLQTLRTENISLPLAKAIYNFPNTKITNF
ncbi:transmembrane protein, putative (macronuclear) [Tetrahymena thermophila SB210]|uniref:Transmembrane protein, putative n=1 Tax=Tetrahymena thermophila (strain SB210) TaxID=312017 RepID=Q23Q79_TETTS|nr:transmembrane protein, putative [Tetrahymena thermophila SB210]EAR98705.2 transmembrane protein, putative [Tetrahymena thermophila SB210]|eukprot:XP_001018950.2 transmembrane protein, putative [Tetrahymena thermophila SB210]